MSKLPSGPSLAVLTLGFTSLVFALLLVPSGFFTRLVLVMVFAAAGWAVLKVRAQGQAMQALTDALCDRLDALEREVQTLRLRAGAAVPVPAAGRLAVVAVPVPVPPEAPSPASEGAFDSAAAARVAPVMDLDFGLPAELPQRLAAAATAGATATQQRRPERAAQPAAAALSQPSSREPAVERAVEGVIERVVGAARDWLLDGNTVARVGLLILFVGVAFLLRYVAERTELPIELRLAGIALGALVFLALGWRMRERRPGFAVTLQGGAIGILYLTAFAALRLYVVVPPLAAFAFMAGLAAISAALAVLQDARALAALGAAGGFLAPLLVSTGTGRIELLFSYYLVLNLGVLAVALFRAWRELNWIAFGFTFGVSGLWAVQGYSAADYPVGQGFLAAFWLLFLAVSLLYALRQPGARRGVIDTLLVFALPLVAFGIQTRFTQGLDLALASVIAAAVYLAAAAWLLRRRDASLQLLAEACFALGVGFLTLAVPLAASAQWTAAAWALEGVALLWVGLRQQRVFPTVAGLLLHVGGAVALSMATERGTLDLAPVLSGTTLNLAVMAACAFASGRLLQGGKAWHVSLAPLVDSGPWLARLVAWGWVALLLWQPLAFPWYVAAWCVLALALMAVSARAVAAQLSPEWIVGAVLVVVAAIAAETRIDADADRLQLVLRLGIAATAVAASLLSLRSTHATQRLAAAGLLTLGVLAWLVALLAETMARVEAAIAVAQLALVLVGVTALALAWLGRRLTWAWPQQLAQSFFAAHLVVAAYVVYAAVFGALRPSVHFGWTVWPAAWTMFYFLLRWSERSSAQVHSSIHGPLHVVALWLLVPMVAAELALRVDGVAGVGWFHATWGAVLALALWLTVQKAVRWPLRAAPFAYASVGVPGLALASLLWLLMGSVRAADAAPLPALPLVNPLDLAALLVLAALTRWHLTDTRPAWHAQVRLLLVAAAFFVVNLIVLRAVHLLVGVAWAVDDLARSLLVQAVLSLLWTLIGMALMVVAHRRALRPLWITGGVLLAVVVAKLFFVDLSGQGTVERIVSFVGVGLLLIVIGYLAPVPPAARSMQAQEAQ